MEADLRGEGEVVAVLDVIDDAIEEALRQRVAVNVVFEPAAKKAIHGMAALLRFR
jgi:peptide subunit release factor 1 (eRF1)